MNESDHPDPVPVLERPIAVIRQQFNYLVELLTFGEMTKEEFLEATREFLFFDDEGTAWMISLENGNWYKFEGDKPVLGEPPEVLFRPIGEPGEEKKPGKKFCTHCGGQLKDESRFCRMCGKQV